MLLWNHLLIQKILPITHYWKLVPTFRVLIITCYNMEGSSAYDMYTWENRPMTAKEISNRNSDAAVRTIFRISNCFKEVSRNLIIDFWKFKNHLRMYRKYWFNVWSLQIFIWRSNPFIASVKEKFLYGLALSKNYDPQ